VIFRRNFYEQLSFRLTHHSYWRNLYCSTIININYLMNNMNISSSVFVAEGVNTTPVTGQSAQIRTS